MIYLRWVGLTAEFAEDAEKIQLNSKEKPLRPLRLERARRAGGKAKAD